MIGTALLLQVAGSNLSATEYQNHLNDFSVQVEDNYDPDYLVNLPMSVLSPLLQLEAERYAKFHGIEDSKAIDDIRSNLEISLLEGNAPATVPYGYT